MLGTEGFAALWGALATALLGSIGFAVRRWITGENHKDRVAELTSLTNAAATMKAGAVSIEDIEGLRRYLRGPAHGMPAAPTAAEVVLSGPLDGGTFAFSQGEMNESAAHALAGAELELRFVIDRISKMLDAPGRAELEEAQERWDAFKVAHANFVTRQFEGGSLQPLWWITMIDRATRDRIEELRTYLEAREGD